MVLKEENGSDSIAAQLVDEKHWDELVILIAVVCTCFLYVKIPCFAFSYLSILSGNDFKMRQKKRTVISPLSFIYHDKEEATDWEI